MMSSTMIVALSVITTLITHKESDASCLTVYRIVGGFAFSRSGGDLYGSLSGEIDLNCCGWSHILM